MMPAVLLVLLQKVFIASAITYPGWSACWYPLRLYSGVHTGKLLLAEAQNHAKANFDLTLFVRYTVDCSNPRSAPQEQEPVRTCQLWGRDGKFKAKEKAISNEVSVAHITDPATEVKSETFALMKAEDTFFNTMRGCYISCNIESPATLDCKK